MKNLINNHMKGKITAVFDWKPYCWDVLMDDGEWAMAFEWPRNQKPVKGDDVEWIPGKGVLWHGAIVAVDQRKPRVDENGTLSFN